MENIETLPEILHNIGFKMNIQMEAVQYYIHIHTLIHVEFHGLRSHTHTHTNTPVRIKRHTNTL